MLSISASAYPDSKPHYAILDGLRGVAAVIDKDRASSLGYAYDDRWGRMTYRDFFKRRLIRLHPMVVMGMLIGAAAFSFGA